MMSYEKLEVYQLALQFLALAFEIEGQLPPGYPGLGDQLKRAAMSCPQNIGEGAGKRTPADCRKFFDIAPGSAMECGVHLDVCAVGKLVDAKLIQRGKEMLEREVAMLTCLSRSQGQNRGRRPG
jgi:four helix bundle protein